MDEILKKEDEVIVADGDEKKEEDGVDSAPVVSDTVIPELNSDPIPPADDTVEVKDDDMPVADAQKMFSQEEVNEMMGQVRAETRDRTFRYIYGRYGVENESGLDDLIGNAQRYDTLKESTDMERASWEAEKESGHKELCDLKERLALLESGIDKDRYEDAKLILRGKGLEVTAETIADELATHPEWKKTEEKKTYTPPSPTIKVPEVPKVLGNESNGKAPSAGTEEDTVMEKYFKLR